jgi:hypothetical protein
VAAVVQRKRTLNREHCLIHCAPIRYHFIIAVWRAKQAQVAAYENEHFVFDSCSVLRVLFDFANSASRATEQFRLAEAEGRLPRLPTGDGAACVFLTHAEGGYCVR